MVTTRGSAETFGIRRAEACHLASVLRRSRRSQAGRVAPDSEWRDWDRLIFRPERHGTTRQPAGIFEATHEQRDARSNDHGWCSLSYIRLDSALEKKIQFRRIAKSLGWEADLLTGRLARVWWLVDALGSTIDGTPTDVADAASVPEALIHAMATQGWAAIRDDAVWFSTKDDTEAARKQANRDRARRLRERNSFTSGQLEEENTHACAPRALRAPPTVPSVRPSIPSDRPNQRQEEEIIPVSLPIEAARAEARDRSDGPSGSLVFTLMSDAELRSLWDAIPAHWRKERSTNYVALAGAVEALAREHGTDRHEAMASLKSAIASYCASVEGKGKYQRTLKRWLAESAWTEEPVAWNHVGEDTSKKRRKAFE